MIKAFLTYSKIDQHFADNCAYTDATNSCTDKISYNNDFITSNIYKINNYKIVMPVPQYCCWRDWEFLNLSNPL